MDLFLALVAQTGGSMSRFVVRFMKDVLGENGREAEVFQGSLEIDASNEGQATELAKRKFFEAQALHPWSLHADPIQGCEPDFPSCEYLIHVSRQSRPPHEGMPFPTVRAANI